MVMQQGFSFRLASNNAPFIFEDCSISPSSSLSGAKSPRVTLDNSNPWLAIDSSNCAPVRQLSKSGPGDKYSALLLIDLIFDSKYPSHFEIRCPIFVAKADDDLISDINWWRRKFIDDRVFLFQCFSSTRSNIVWWCCLNSASQSLILFMSCGINYCSRADSSASSFNLPVVSFIHVMEVHGLLCTSWHGTAYVLYLLTYFHN